MNDEDLGVFKTQDYYQQIKTSLSYLSLEELVEYKNSIRRVFQINILDSNTLNKWLVLFFATEEELQSRKKQYP